MPEWATVPDRSAADRTLYVVSAAAAVMPVLALLFLTVQMVAVAAPALVYSGTDFLAGHIFTFGNLYGGDPSVQNGVTAPHGAAYGAAALVLGTLLTSIIAVVLAAPFGVGGVLLLVELPEWTQSLVSVVLEMLASIPSVVYGLWGILTFGPFLSHNVYPLVAASVGAWIPFFGGSTGYGQGLLTAGLVLAIMIVPIVAATTRELVRSVPALTREGAVALGLTRYETIRTVTLPFVQAGIAAATLLGWARALGETMAVLMISGNALNILPHSIYAPTSTLAGTIAAMLDAALTDATDMSLHALAALGLVLLVLTLATNLVGRGLIRRLSSEALPIGRGL